MAKKRIKMRKARGCSTGTVAFKTKRGKTVSFHGRHGPACSPRKFRKGVTPAALRPYAAAMKTCAKKYKPGTKAIGKCVVAKVG